MRVAQAMIEFTGILFNHRSRDVKTFRLLLPCVKTRG
jgi:hypothetical protein